MIRRDNRPAVVATPPLARQLDVGAFFGETTDLCSHLRDERRIARLRANARRHRPLYTFDHHAERLVAFFREVIGSRC